MDYVASQCGVSHGFVTEDDLPDTDYFHFVTIGPCATESSVRLFGDLCHALFSGTYATDSIYLPKERCKAVVGLNELVHSFARSWGVHLLVPTGDTGVVPDDKPGGKNLEHFQFIGLTQGTIQRVMDYVRSIVVGSEKEGVDF